MNSDESKVNRQQSEDKPLERKNQEPQEPPHYPVKFVIYSIIVVLILLILIPPIIYILLTIIGPSSASAWLDKTGKLYFLAIATILSALLAFYKMHNRK